MTTNGVSAVPQDDKLAQLARKIRDYRPGYPVYRWISWLCIFVGSISSILRWYNGWTYADAPLWLNIAFSGGYFLGIVIGGPALVWDMINYRRCDNALKEFARERERRGLGLRDEQSVLKSSEERSA